MLRREDRCLYLEAGVGQSLAEFRGVELVVHGRDAAVAADLFEAGDILVSCTVVDRKQYYAVGELPDLLPHSGTHLSHSGV